MPSRKKKSTHLIQSKKELPLNGKECDIVILFADVVGCSEISNHKTLAGYSKFITSFQKCFEKVCKYYEENEYKNRKEYFDYETRGDEGCLKIYPPGSYLADDIDIALNIALDLKRMWLLEEDNNIRITESGLLPIEIAIGIHSGKAWLKEDEGVYKPEGYAINLTKRIESDSRKGEFSRILISESSYNHINHLRDERTYRFREPFTITPKGISQNIKVFEVKHHFLSTDWSVDPYDTSMIYDDLRDTDLEVIKKAYGCNPMNLWLAEEYILLSIMNINKNIKGEKSPKQLKAIYKEVTKVAQEIATSDLRDAGILSLLGFVYGEQENFVDEQKMYRAGLKLDELDGLLYWYLAYSCSCSLLAEMEKEGINIYVELDVLDTNKIQEFYDKNVDNIKDIFETYKTAIELEPTNPWIRYDLACEKSWWSLGVKTESKRNEFKELAVKNLNMAYALNPLKIKLRTIDEYYLNPIKNIESVKNIFEV